MSKCLRRKKEKMIINFEVKKHNLLEEKPTTDKFNIKIYENAKKIFWGCNCGKRTEKSLT